MGGLGQCAIIGATAAIAAGRVRPVRGLALDGPLLFRRGGGVVGLVRSSDVGFPRAVLQVVDQRAGTGGVVVAGLFDESTLLRVVGGVGGAVHDWDGQFVFGVHGAQRTHHLA